MRHAVSSAPMTKPDMGQEKYIEGVRFAPMGEEIRAFCARTAGKLLLVTDGASLPELAAASASRRAVTVVLEEDALPLFAMPDGVGGVIGAGRAPLLRAVRYFAEIHSVPALLFPSDASLDGVFERTGDILLDGRRAEVPLAEGETVCDLNLLRPTLANACARLLLARLAVFEARALSRFGVGKYASICEKAVEILSNGELSAEGIVRRNALLRQMEEEGFPKGEGVFLSDERAGGNAIHAYRMLFALYCAFFRKGRPRKYFVPDYRMRAQRADCAYSAIPVPTPEEYASRAFALERMRSTAIAELDLIERMEPTFLRTFRALGGTVSDAPDTERLSTLAERFPAGLCAVIRDFGLFEQNMFQSPPKRGI